MSSCAPTTAEEQRQQQQHQQNPASSLSCHPPAMDDDLLIDDTDDPNLLLLDSAYRFRLKIEPSTPLTPNFEILCLLVERHLRYVPFENLSLHGAGPRINDTDTDDGDEHDHDHDEPPIPLSLPTLTHKILTRNRGGCCFELNGLLGHYLHTVLGYRTVRLVPCWVYAGPERGHTRNRNQIKFRTRQSHAFLFVRTLSAGVFDDGDANNANDGEGDDDIERREGKGEGYILDVGLGEPPLHPLRYSTQFLGVEQVTPEGMKSRIIREQHDWSDGDGRVRKCCRLEWWKPCRRCHFVNAAQGWDGANDETVQEVTKLASLAQDLRSAAAKARRKSHAKPRSAFKVYASDPAVRNEAKMRCNVAKQRREQETNADESVVVEVEPCQVRREICGMWSALHEEDRAAYADRALEEMECLKEEADRAAVKAAAAQREADRAEEEVAVSSGRQNHHNCASSCDEKCGGAGGYWEPRLQWDVADAPLAATPTTAKEESFVDNRALASFADAVDIITGEGSTFVRKALACVLTREEKLTLAGNVLKVTTPRFAVESSNSSIGEVQRGRSVFPVQTSIELKSTEEVRTVLQERFSISMKETEDLDFSVASVNSAELWDHL